jgi:hypothetical protein
LANGCAETLPVDEASAWIDHRYGITADDEADVGYRVFVLRGGVFVRAASDVDSFRDFLGDKRWRLARAFLCEGADGPEARRCE